MTIPKFAAFEVKKYRSLMDVKIDMSDEMPVIICGENNIGKTNFLRALNLYFNHALIDDLFNPKIDIPHHIYEGSRGAGSKTELIGYFSENDIKTKLSVTFKDNGKIFHYRNGQLIAFDVAKRIS